MWFIIHGKYCPGVLALVVQDWEVFGHTRCGCMAAPEPSLRRITGKWQLQFFEYEDTCYHMASWVLTILKQVAAMLYHC